jgi:hypothetical protein
VVECTGLENQQSRKVLVGSNPTASANRHLNIGMATFHNSKLLSVATLVAAACAGACTSIPGETLAPSGIQGEIRDRIYALARAVDPQCRQQKIANTEVVELHAGGQVAEERWTLENCRQKLVYLVSYPPRPTGAARFQVRPER